MEAVAEPKIDEYEDPGIWLEDWYKWRGVPLLCIQAKDGAMWRCGGPIEVRDGKVFASNGNECKSSTEPEFTIFAQKKGQSFPMYPEKQVAK